jgi:hypothetical protein
VRISLKEQQIDGISPPFGKLHPNMGFMGMGFMSSWEVGGVP